MMDKNISISHAIKLLREGYEVMVKPYDNDIENFTGITIEDFEGQNDYEIEESLASYTDLQYWSYINSIEVIN